MPFWTLWSLSASTGITPIRTRVGVASVNQGQDFPNLIDANVCFLRSKRRINGSANRSSLQHQFGRCGRSIGHSQIPGIHGPQLVDLH